MPATLDIDLFPKQAIAMEYLLYHPEVIDVLFGGAAYGGKTWVGCEWLQMLCRCYPGVRLFVGRKTLKRLKQTVLITFRKVAEERGLKPSEWRYNEQMNQIEFTNGSVVVFLELKFKPSDDLQTTFGSMEFTSGWIDQPEEVEFVVFDVLSTRINRHLNDKYKLPAKMLLTPNPAKGWLYLYYYRPWKEKTLEKDKVFIPATFKDNLVNKEQYETQLNRISSEATKQRLKFGNWEYDDSKDVLMEYDAILDMFVAVPSDETTMWLTADIARFGQAKTVIKIWRGYDIIFIDYWEKEDLTFTSQRISELASEYKVARSRIIIDESGVGGGVLDNLPGAKGFIANSQSVKVDGQKENYKDLKSQCSFMLADKINDRIVSISAEIDPKVKNWIIEELEQVRALNIERDAPLQVVPKEVVEELIRRSPDFSDTMVLRMYGDLIPIKKGRHQATTFRPNIREYKKHKAVIHRPNIREYR